MPPSDTSLEHWVAQLPKTETHLHLEGALPWSLLQAVDPVRFSRPPDSWHKTFRFRDFAHFERELLDMAGAWYRSPDRYAEAARFIFRDLVRHNVRYVETSLASGVFEFFGLNGREVFAAVRAAVPPGLAVRLILGIHHNGYNERSRAFLDHCLDWPDLDGLDLHGTETLPLEPWTAPLWAEARRRGKLVKAHAGEFCGPDFIRRVLDELGVKRLQHGVRAIEDPSLVAHLRDAGVGLDVCPISNIKLGVVAGPAAHPLPRLIRGGVRCTINTDDPLSFGNTLTGECLHALTVLGLTRAELVACLDGGFAHALAEPDAIAAWRRELHATAGPLDQSP